MLKADWEIEVRDKDGKLLLKKRFKSHSYLRAFLGLMKGQFGVQHLALVGEGNESVPDVGNVGRTYPRHRASDMSYQVKISALSPSGEGAYGIVVGTDDSVNVIGQFALIGKIAHGTGSGQLTHGAHSIDACWNPATTMEWRFRLIRTFTNGSGATITVREIGINVRDWDAGGVAREWCVARDVISPVAVPNGSTLTVRYIPRITVA